MRLDLRLHDLQPRFGEITIEVDPRKFRCLQPCRGFFLAGQEVIAEDAGGDHVAPEDQRGDFLQQRRRVLAGREQQVGDAVRQEAARDQSGDDRADEGQHARHGPGRGPVARDDHGERDRSEQREKIDVLPHERLCREIERFFGHQQIDDRMPQRGQTDACAEDCESHPCEAVPRSGPAAARGRYCVRRRGAMRAHRMQDFRHGQALPECRLVARHQDGPGNDSPPGSKRVTTGILGRSPDPKRTFRRTAPAGDQPPADQSKPARPA